ncbi:MAG: M16 family metallopeptidase [Cyanobacteriota bacterium]|jgi:predicted Zn-dependent peptidase
MVLLFRFWGALLCLLLWGTGPSAAQTANPEIERYLTQAQANISQFTLDNGMTFIVKVNPRAPVVSFYTYADVGGVDEPEGQTGVAHFLEHMAFKGTRRIGTKDYAQEAKLLEELDRVSADLRRAQAEGAPTEALARRFQELQEEAGQYVKRNELGQIVQESGGVGMNAATSADSTVYFYSLPANKLELWMSLESERFLEPVFREFYQEQQVILEERRLRTDNSPIGQMIEAFLDAAFKVHPYRRPVIGYDADIRNLRRQDVAEFFERYYGPGNLTVAIVGDVDPAQVKKLAQTYFGRFPKRAAPPALTAQEPPQREPRSVTLALNSQPWYLEGYHRPGADSPDDAVYEVLTTILSSGRTSRLYQSLVEEGQIALVAQGFNGFPGDKYPNLLLFYAQVSPQGSLEAVETALAREIERLKIEPVSAEELRRAKTLLQAELLRSLDSNSGLAELLARYQAKTGDWRNLFKKLTAIAQVSPADLQRVARQTFTPENRTVGRLQSSPGAGGS